MPQNENNNPQNGIAEKAVDFESANGARLITRDSEEFVDMDCRSGAVILGHAHEQVVTALTKASRRGLATMSESHLESKFSALLKSAFGGFETSFFCGSPLSALLAAMHAARDLTGRCEVITIGSHTSDVTTDCDYNDIDSVKAVFDRSDEKPAALVITPIFVDYSIIRPQAGYLSELREICSKHNTVLIFDERITGFRLTYGCAQSLYEIQPDMSVLGGVIGGGLAIGAILTGSELAEHIQPQPLKANPLAMACGLAALEPLRDGSVYGRLEAIGASLGEGLTRAADKSPLEIEITRSGSMVSVKLDSDIARCEQLYKQLRSEMLNRQIYLPNMAQSPWFVTAAHQDKDINAVVSAADEAFASLK